MAPETDLCTTKVAASMLDVTPDTVRRWVKEGRLAPVRLPSGRMRFRRSDVEAQLTPDVPAVAGDCVAGVEPPGAPATPPAKSA